MTHDTSPPLPPTRRARRTAKRRRSAGDIITLVIGELLFTGGAFIGLFLLWQMWYTNFEASANNQQAVAVIEEKFQPRVEKTVEPEQRRTDLPPAAEPVGKNQGFATLYVPRWGSDYKVGIAEGLSYSEVLNHGLIGHYPQTSLIGEIGNAGLAAHRMTRGSVFQHIDTLQDGDEVIVETDKAWMVFKVKSHEIVLPDAGEVLYPVPYQPGVEATEAMLTLTTCHPLMSTRERYIVYTTLDYWIPRDAGMPEAILEAQ